MIRQVFLSAKHVPIKPDRKSHKQTWPITRTYFFGVLFHYFLQFARILLNCNHGIATLTFFSIIYSRIQIYNRLVERIHIKIAYFFHQELLKVVLLLASPHTNINITYNPKVYKSLIDRLHAYDQHK